MPAVLGPNPAELTRLLPELGERFAGLAPRTSTSREIEQYRLFEAMRGWLAAQSATSPLVLVVDDAQWATAETLQMLGHVARSAEPSGLVLVCTARTTAPDSSPQLADLATDLQRASVPARVAALADLAEAEVAELVLAQGGERLAGSATRLFRETGGNPLFLVTLLAAFTGGSWDLAESLPSSVQEIVRRRLRTVPGEVVELLRLAALVGLDFDLKIVAAAFAAQEEELIDRLDIATAAGLVVETGYNRYRFAHGLVREALRSELSETRRVRTHARIGLAIEQLNPDLVDELAHHFWEAREAGHGQAAYRYALAAGTRAVALLSYGDAVGHFSRAVLLAPTSERPGWRLAQGLAEHHSGDMLRGLATMGAAAREAELAGQLEVFADAALAMEANSWQPAAFSEEVADLLERALTALGADAVDRSIRLRASLGRAWLYSGRSIEAYELGSQALADARGLGDHETIGYALVRLAYNAPQWRDTASLSSLVDELGDLVGRSADDDLVMQAMNLRLLLLSRLGRLGEIRKENPGFAARAESLREPFWSFGSRFYALGLAFAEGELARVEQIIEQIQEMEQNVGAGDHSGADGLRTFQLRREQGRLAEIEPAMGLLLRLRSRASLWQPGLAATLAGLGWLEETRQVLDGLELSGLADDNLRELALCLLSEAVDALDGHPLALQLYRELLPSSGLSVHFGHGLVSPGPVDRYLGMLAALTGDRQQAEQHFAAALQLARAMSAPLYIGHVLADWGRWLVRWGCATDAVGMLAEAAAIAEANQLKALRQRVGSGR